MDTVYYYEGATSIFTNLWYLLAPVFIMICCVVGITQPAIRRHKDGYYFVEAGSDWAVFLPPVFTAIVMLLLFIESSDGIIQFHENWMYRLLGKDQDSILAIFLAIITILAIGFVYCILSIFVFDLARTMRVKDYEFDADQLNASLRKIDNTSENRLYYQKKNAELDRILENFKKNHPGEDPDKDHREEEGDEN